MTWSKGSSGWIKDDGVWKKAWAGMSIFIKDQGTWKASPNGWMKDDGVWKPLWEPSGPPDPTKPKAGQVGYIIIGAGGFSECSSNSSTMLYGTGGGGAEVIAGVLDITRGTTYSTQVAGNNTEAVNQERGQAMAGYSSTFNGIVARGGRSRMGLMYAAEANPFGSGDGAFTAGQPLPPDWPLGSLPYPGGAGAGGNGHAGVGSNGGAGGDGVTFPMLDDVQIGQLVDGHYWVAGGGGGMCAVGGTPGVGGKGNDGVHARQGAAVSTATTPVKYTTIPGGGGAVGTAASGINSSTFTAGAQGGHGAIILRTLESEPDATITNGTKMVVNGYRYYIFRHTGTHYVAYTNGSIRWA